MSMISHDDILNDLPKVAQCNLLEDENGKYYDNFIDRSFNSIFAGALELLIISYLIHCPVHVYIEHSREYRLLAKYNYSSTPYTTRLCHIFIHVVIDC